MTLECDELFDDYDMHDFNKSSIWTPLHLSFFLSLLPFAH